MWLLDIISYAKGSGNELLILQGLGSILRYEKHPRIQRGMISILITRRFCVGLCGTMRCKSHNFYKSSQYGIHMQTIAIYTTGITELLSPTQGNNKLGRDLTASLPPVPQCPTALPVSLWLVILAACTCLSHLSPGLTARLRLC